MWSFHCTSVHLIVLKMKKFHRAIAITQPVDKSPGDLSRAIIALPSNTTFFFLPSALSPPVSAVATQKIGWEADASRWWEQTNELLTVLLSWTPVRRWRHLSVHSLHWIWHLAVIVIDFVASFLLKKVTIQLQQYLSRSPKIGVFSVSLITMLSRSRVCVERQHRSLPELRYPWPRSPPRMPVRESGIADAQDEGYCYFLRLLFVFCWYWATSCFSRKLCANPNALLQCVALKTLKLKWWWSYSFGDRTMKFCTIMGFCKPAYLQSRNNSSNFLNSVIDAILKTVGKWQLLHFWEVWFWLVVK